VDVIARVLNIVKMMLFHNILIVAWKNKSIKYVYMSNLNSNSDTYLRIKTAHS
jgi:hypothetical protein